MPYISLKESENHTASLLSCQRNRTNFISLKISLYIFVVSASSYFSWQIIGAFGIVFVSSLSILKASKFSNLELWYANLLHPNFLTVSIIAELRLYGSIIETPLDVK